jgi:sugar phosphate isomerase/epimerase
MPLAAFPKCYLDMLVVSHQMSVDEWIDMSAKLDVDGLEFYWGFTPHGQPAELERIRRRVEDQGRTISMMCYSPDFTKPDPEARKFEIQQQKKAIEATAALGGTFCRVLSGQRRPDVSREQGLKWVTECISACTGHASENDVTLILENHYKDGYWNYPEFAQKMDVFLDLLDRLSDQPCLAVNYDPSNAIIAGDDPIELLEAVKHRVATMHASDRFFEGGTIEDLQRIEANPKTGYAGILKHGVIGQGLVDYDKIFSILKEAGFHGWISIEDGDDPVRGMENLEASVAFLRSKMREHRMG